MRYLLMVFILVFGIESAVHAASKKNHKKGKREIASYSEKHKKNKKKKKSGHHRRHHGMNETAPQVEVLNS